MTEHIAPVRYLPLELRLLLEWPRFLIGTRPERLAHLPRGNGEPVMVLPGWGLDDRATLPFRRALMTLGYDVHGWSEGPNLGIRSALMKRLDARVDELSQAGAVSLVGWSYGGVVARELARHRPTQVRRVFTLGSPINGVPEANTISAVYRLLGRTSAVDRATFDKRRQAPPVPCVAIHTKSDGIVAWRCTIEEPAPNTENVEVRGSHGGLIANLEVLHAIAHRLSLPSL